MDPIEQISHNVKIRVDRLGTEIIRVAEEKKVILGSTDLSDADRTAKINAVRDGMRQNMDVVFGEGDGSISFDIRRVLEAGIAPAAEKDRIRKAADIWLQELPGLRGFLDYCAGMIEAHLGDMSPELRKSQKCITEASVVLDKISSRVDREVR